MASSGAVNALANTTTDHRSKARSLIVVIRMICESIRFARISSHISITTNYTAQSGFSPAPWMNKLETNWGNLSSLLLKKDADPDYKFIPLPIDDKHEEIYTVEQAVAILGVLLGGSTTVLFRQPQAEAQGQPMVEMF